MRVGLDHRYAPEFYDQLKLRLRDGFQEPFLGEVDMKPSLREHHVRCPHSFNVKGNRFSYFVESCEDFSPEIADELNARILRCCAGHQDTGGGPCAALR